MVPACSVSVETVGGRQGGPLLTGKHGVHMTLGLLGLVYKEKHDISKSDGFPNVQETLSAEGWPAEWRQLSLPMAGSTAGAGVWCQPVPVLRQVCLWYHIGRGTEKRWELLHGQTPSPAKSRAGCGLGVSGSNPQAPSPPQEMRNPDRSVSGQV